MKRRKLYSEKSPHLNEAGANTMAKKNSANPLITMQKYGYVPT